MKKNKIVELLLGVLIILMIPVIGMLVSDEWNWGLLDFVVIFTLFFGAGLVYQYIASKLKKKKDRILVGIIILGAVFLVYVELATDAVSRSLNPGSGCKYENRSNKC